MDISIVVCEEVKVVGMKKKASMASAHEDAMALWGAFAPKMGEFMVLGGSYGVSFMLTESDFNYYAAVQNETGAKLPADFEQITLPRGLYARISSSKTAEMGDIFCYIYDEWMKEQSEYVLDYAAPCYEYYHVDYMKSCKYDILFPIKKK